MKILGYERHPIANAFALLEGHAWTLFLEDVKANGLIDDRLTLYKGKLLDGSNRGRAAEELGLKVKFVEYDGNDPIGYVVSRNLQRRQLDESQRAMVACKLCTLQQGQRKSRKFAGLTQDEAAKLLNVSERSVQSARRVDNLAVPEVVAAVERGDIAVSRAAEIAGMPADLQLKRLEAETAPATTRPRKTPTAKNDEQLSPEAAHKQLLRVIHKAVEQLGATTQALYQPPDEHKVGVQLSYAGCIFQVTVQLETKSIAA